jgi:aminoglycoside phosphotransferase (APT) family kinase protein
VNVWSLSAILRFPVTRAGADTDVWFKASCDVFRSEPMVTASLADLAPDVVPLVLAVDERRAWMLLDPIPGADDDAGVEHVADVASALARLQLDSLPHTTSLQASGLPHRGLDHTLAWLHEVVTASVELLMLTQEQRSAAVEAESWLADQVRELWSLGFPDTLCHGDLHLGNVAWVGDGPILFDWTDACLGHPYLDAVHLARSTGIAGADKDRTVLEPYLREWRLRYPDLDHDRAWELAWVVERIFQMISYEQIYRAQPEGSRWELATIVAAILPDLVALRSR